MISKLEIPDELIKEVIVIINKGVFHLKPYTKKEKKAQLFLLDWCMAQSKEIPTEEIMNYGKE
jgi:hypothetical protein